MGGSLAVTVVGQSLVKRDIGRVADPRFGAVRALIGAADVAFTNFEGTVAGAHGGWPTKPGFFGAVPPAMLDLLAELGFGALSLANNHAFDLGPGGVLSTLDAVAARGFLAAGIGADAAAAARPGVVRLGSGRDVALVAVDAGPLAESATAKDATDRVPARPGVNPLRVRPATVVPQDLFDQLRGVEAALGHRARTGDYRTAPRPDAPGTLDFYGQLFAAGPAAARIGMVDDGDRDRTLAAIAAARAQGCFVIAYVHHHHWEARWEEVPGWMQVFARDCIEAGADLVASHGVPMLQGIEIHRGRPIFYSLGNFIFHSFAPAGWHHDDIWRSVVAACRFEACGDLAEIVLHPIVLGGEAALRSGDFAARDVPLLAEEDGPGILSRLAGLSAGFGTQIVISGAVGRITP